MKKPLMTALLLVAASVSGLARAVPADVARKIIVFDASTSRERRLAMARTGGATVVRELPLINAVVIQTPVDRIQAASDGLEVMAEVDRIEDDPTIDWLQSGPWADFAAPDMSGLFAPLQDHVWRVSAGSDLPWGIKRVDAPAAWKTTEGQGVKIAVLDTGINYLHPDLQRNLAGGWNVLDQNPDFLDDNGHGTHCAGIIAALGLGGVEGVAPKASLYGVKAMNSLGQGSFSDIIAGLQWAVDNRMQIVSMSLGSKTGTPALQAAVAAALKAGVVVVAAAGNNGPGPVEFPGAYPGVLAVAASDDRNRLASFSSRGPEVSFIAPGVDVYSTYENSYEKLSGTSMAGPHVAGLAALVIAAKGLTGPDQVGAALRGAAEPLKGLTLSEQGAGMVDAAVLVR